MQKNNVNKVWIIVLAIISFAGGLATGHSWGGGQIDGPVSAEQNQTSEQQNGAIDLSLFWNVVSRINNEYVDANAINSEKAVYGAIKGMVASLDDSYTVFMDPEESKQFQQDLNGELEGIGAELGLHDDKLTVLSVLKKSPAEKAGLMPKDVIYKIDDNFTEDLSLFEAITKIRGKKGTKVTLTLVREDQKDPIIMDINRDTINVESVSYELVDGNIAYVSINQFSDSTAKELSAVISKLLLDGADGVVLDLRYNGGGYLDISVDILSDFIEEGQKVVSLKRRNSNDENFVTSGHARLADLPLVVLINQGSASASEIVAGAVQDLKRGFIIGEQSFGKGSVQEVIKLDDGSSLRMTIAKWFTAKGRDIDHVGLTPDMVVKLTREDILDGKDPQKDAAVAYVKNLLK